MSTQLGFDVELDIELALAQFAAESGGEIPTETEVIDTAPLWAPAPANKPQRAAFESKADILGYGGAAHGGKALALNTPLPTPIGWSTMREVQAGDYLLDDQGVCCQIRATSKIFRHHKCYSVTFDDGEVIIADADHGWLTFTSQEREQTAKRNEEFRAKRRATRPIKGKGKRPDLSLRNSQFRSKIKAPPTGSVRTTAEIASTLLDRRGSANHSIPLALALNLPRNPYLKPKTLIYLVQPYTLGAWLGDGKTKQGKIYVQDSDLLIVARVRADGYKVRNVPSEPLGRTILGLQSDLRKLGVLGNKHIPGFYLRAPYRDRLDLMQGLMDTDGHCDEDGGAEFTSTRKVLALGVLELARTLGIKATMIEGRATLNGRDCGPRYRVKMTTAIRLFGLPRKTARQNKKVRPTQAQRYIVDCIPVKSVPVKCVQVNSPSRLYLAGNAMVPTHNSDLLLGLAVTKHRVSKIFRREHAQLQDLIDRAREIIPNEYMNLKGVCRMPTGQRITLLGVKNENDINKHKGRPADLFGFDEATEFTENQVRFLLGWNRTVHPNQRCRAVLCFNPPTTAEGRWILTFFAPWLLDTHPNPAAPGELRWYAMLADGVEIERPDGEPFEHKGELIFPRSRTFIPARATDNPYTNQDYISVLQSLPGVLRAQLLYGDFKAGIKDDPWQVIPTEWVQLAQARWVDAGGRRPVGSQLDAIGVDVARGGKDQTILAPRYRNFLAPLVRFQGAETDDGPKVATQVGLLIMANGAGRPQPDINIDAIGVGTSPYDCLIAQDLVVNAINNGEAADPEARDRSGKLGFANKRAENMWKFREMLDPAQGHEIMLPPDPELLADLTAAKWTLTVRGIQIELKKETAKRIHRSPDAGDAVVNAFILNPPKRKVGQPASAGRRASSSFKMQ